MSEVYQDIKAFIILMALLFVTILVLAIIPKQPDVVSEYNLIDITSVYEGVYQISFKDENSNLQQIRSDSSFYRVNIILDNTTKIVWVHQNEMNGTMEVGWYRGTYYIHITNYSIINQKIKG